MSYLSRYTLRRLRLRAGKTIQACADAAGYSRWSWSRWENGHIPCPLSLEEVEAAIADAKVPTGPAPEDIRALFDGCGLTRAQIAQALNISTTTLYAWLADRQRCTWTLETLRQVLDAHKSSFQRSKRQS